MARKTRSQFPGPFPIKDDFRAGLRRQFIAVNDAAAAEMFRITLGVGNIVAVGQENVVDAPQVFQSAHERHDELGRVDQPVAGGVPNE